jgi:hypothetical protein
MIKIIPQNKKVMQCAGFMIIGSATYFVNAPDYRRKLLAYVNRVEPVGQTVFYLVKCGGILCHPLQQTINRCVRFIERTHQRVARVHGAAGSLAFPVKVSFVLCLSKNAARCQN